MEDKKRIAKLNLQLNRLSKRYSKFVYDLQQRFCALEKDLKIIVKSEKLKSELKIMGIPTFLSVLAYIHDNFSILEFQEIENEKLLFPDFSRWKIHEKVLGRNAYYWLSVNESTKRTRKDTTSLNYPIIGIKRSWSAKIHVYNKKTKKIEKVFQNLGINYTYIIHFFS